MVPPLDTQYETWNYGSRPEAVSTNLVLVINRQNDDIKKLKNINK